MFCWMRSDIHRIRNWLCNLRNYCKYSRIYENISEWELVCWEILVWVDLLNIYRILRLCLRDILMIIGKICGPMRILRILLKKLVDLNWIQFRIPCVYLYESRNNRWNIGERKGCLNLNQAKAREGEHRFSLCTIM